MTKGGSNVNLFKENVLIVILFDILDASSIIHANYIILKYYLHVIDNFLKYNIKFTFWAVSYIDINKNNCPKYCSKLNLYDKYHIFCHFEIYMTFKCKFILLF